MAETDENRPIHRKSVEWRLFFFCIFQKKNILSLGARGAARRSCCLRCVLLASPPRKGHLPAKRSSGFAYGEMARLESKIRGAPP